MYSFIGGKNQFVKALKSERPKNVVELVRGLYDTWNEHSVPLTYLHFPQAKNLDHNYEVAAAGKLFPHADAFRTEGRLASDNILGGTLEGFCYAYAAAAIAYVALLVNSHMGGADAGSTKAILNSLETYSGFIAGAGATVGAFWGFARDIWKSIGRHRTMKEAKRVVEMYAEYLQQKHKS